ncbi:hypothetical protein H6F88_01975 [Oculatella sp. FACHB-28]|uniref:hypothetical protein n=1 Tax=Oculatella sp. FACHB-28 TaxID=2692845 RepID=UPI00168A066C|nr:hypothetical protein [Oculatella sp. FACHB-28]MBD2054802.1 hypothetical protein [Oculatella sp. FACHB-28]
MAIRTHITLPEALYNRLQLVKDSIGSVSGICQKAIERAVAMEEINRKEISGMDKLVERLRLEMEEAAENWHSQGIEDGRRGAINLSLRDFKFLETLEYTDYDGMNINLSREFYSSELFDSIKEEYLEGDWDNGKPDEEPYLKGWIEGAISIYREAKERL